MQSAYQVSQLNIRIHSVNRSKLVLSFVGEDYLERRNLLNILFKIILIVPFLFILSQCYERLEMIQN